MVRLTILGAKLAGAAARLVLLGGLGCGCAPRVAATTSAAPEAKAEPQAPAPERLGMAAAQAKLRACYDNARERDPALAAHTVIQYFARGGRIVFADVELPQAPALAQCFREALLGSDIGGPGAQEVGSFSSGGMPLHFGPAPLPPTPPPSPAEWRARNRRMTLEALRSGVLHEDDLIVRELLNPAPPWPTAAMRAELDACHHEALSAHPGLVLHRSVFYLSRGRRVLLATVSTPEAPALARCLEDRIATWASPFPETSGSELSSFFIDLGGPEQFPDPPVDLTSELARRDALVERARKLGLISADDPLLERLKRTSPGEGG